MDKKAQSGFTLYELMVTLMIMGVILAYGVPNLRQFQLNNRMVAANNDLLGAFSMARTEAIKRKTNVTLCATAEWDLNDPTCGVLNDAAITWHEGWVVFVDTNGDLDVDLGAGGDVILRVSGPPSGNDTTDPAASGNIKVVTNNNSQYFSFRGTGYSRGNVAGQEALSAAYIYDYRGNMGADGGVSTARILLVSTAGRAQMYRDPTLITQICLDTDFNLTCP